VCLYQGEELGLTEADLAFEDLVDPYGIRFWPEFRGRDGCRTPMVWEADAPHAGFTAGRPWLPVPESHLTHAVDRQGGDGSVLAAYRRIIGFRRGQQALRTGDIVFLSSRRELLAFLRTAGNETLLCVFNLGPTPDAFALPADMSVEALHGHGFTGHLAGDHIALDPEEAFFGRVI
ncbi:MAG TPA: alpha-glucosidase C-terminal domain-containing protein, partial [Methylomirabilota bacterium]|nr:alpha-glucosidase C-terminal domain-containing protein [Methylomirabilota bacterium]